MTNTTQAVTLTEFLLARIAEDEAAAKAATLGPWRSTMCRHGGGELGIVHVVLSADPMGQFADVGESMNPDADAAHIARHDPARVLAECEAKRRIVELFAPFAQSPRKAGEPDAAAQWALSDVCEHLAAIYAGHPDYRAEWSA